MTRVLCLLTVVLWTLASQAQDFAQHFIETCNDDTAVSYVTISPKMFEEMKIRQGLVKDESMRKALDDIKSVRIIEVTRKGKKYFNKAESQLKRNSNRFELLPESSTNNLVAVRKRNGNIVEHLTICYMPKKEPQFLILDITGNNLNSVIRYLDQLKLGRKE